MFMDVWIGASVNVICYWCSWMYGWKMVWDEHSYICYLFCLFSSHLHTVKNRAQCFFMFFLCFFYFFYFIYHCYDMFLFRSCYCLGVIAARMSAGKQFTHQPHSQPFTRVFLPFPLTAIIINSFPATFNTNFIPLFQPSLIFFSFHHPVA